MKIAILNQARVWAGAEVHTIGLAAALTERGHDAFVVCLDDQTHTLYRSSTNGAVPLVSLRTSKPVARRNLLDWLLALGEVSADACVYEKGTLHAGSFALDLAARMRFSRYVTIENLEPPPLPIKSSKRRLGGLVPGLGLWWYRWLFSGYLRSLAPHKVIGCSNAVCNQLTRNYRFAQGKVATVHNAIDPLRFRPDAGFRREMRRHWGLTDNAVVFGSVRRLVREKGLDLAVEAFAEFLKKAPGREAALVLVGDGPERVALERLAAERGVGRQVILTGVMLVPWQAYAAFDVFLIPSRVEAFGISLLEGMAAGCCSIAANVGGIPEIMTDPSLGWLVHPDDAHALAHAMEAAYGMTSEERARLGNRSREHVVKHFNAQAQYAKIAEIIEAGGQKQLVGACGRRDAVRV